MVQQLAYRSPRLPAFGRRHGKRGPFLCDPRSRLRQIKPANNPFVLDTMMLVTYILSSLDFDRLMAAPSSGDNPFPLTHPPSRKTSSAMRGWDYSEWRQTNGGNCLDLLLNAQ